MTPEQIAAELTKAQARALSVLVRGRAMVACSTEPLVQCVNGRACGMLVRLDLAKWYDNRSAIITEAGRAVAAALGEREARDDR